MSKLYQVLYCSRTALPLDDTATAAEIQSILMASRRNNARDGLSGGLLFSEGCFAQVLEGSMAAVTDTFERIQCDARHSAVTVLQAGFVDHRDFPSWSMGFAGTPSDAPGSRFLTEAFVGRTGAGDQILGLLRRAVRENDAMLLPLS